MVGPGPTRPTPGYATVQSIAHLFNVTMVNHFLRNSVTVTLQWPREAGAVYRVNIIPEAPHTELTNHHNNVVMSLTISYNIQYNVSIVHVSSLCGVTTCTTKILKYGF